MHRRKFRLTPSVLAIPLFLCSFAGIVTAGAEERMHGLEIFRSGNIVITSSAVSDGIAKKGDRASLHDRWCRPRLVVDVYSPNREPFDGNREGLKRALEEFRTFLSADCPRAREIYFSCQALDGSVYRNVYNHTISDLSAGIVLEAAEQHLAVNPKPGPSPKPLVAPQRAQREGETPPELSSKPVLVPQGETQMRGPPLYTFHYQDAMMSGDYKGEIGVEPIEEVNASLFQSGYKCLASRSVNFNASNPRPRLQLDHFRTKRYVIFCSGQCQNLTYRFATRGFVAHMGKSQPIPIVQLVYNDLGHGDVPFEFYSDNPSATGTVTVSQWSDEFGDYGGGCAGTMFEQAKPN